MKDNTAPHSVWQVPGGELEVSIDTNMFEVADSAIQQRTGITKCVINTQLEKIQITQSKNCFLPELPPEQLLNVCIAQS